MFQVDKSQRIVIKLGTRVVIDPDGQVAHDRLLGLLSSVKKFWDEGREVVLVSSGAVELGKAKLKSARLPLRLSLQEKQACAAVGQGLLMHLYQSLFEGLGLVSAQLLLTAHELSDRSTYLNLRKTFESLLENKVIPIVNENDSVSTSELVSKHESQSFGDNDRLSALVASKLTADLLILLTDVDGIFKKDPAVSQDAEKITLIKQIRELGSIQKGAPSAQGRGGMVSKVEAARIASISGVSVVIASGYNKGVLDRVICGHWPSNGSKDSGPGTLILPQTPWSSRKKWIGFSCGFEGIVLVNDGAKKALVQGKSSLLAVGVVGFEGDFSRGEVVSVQTGDGQELGRGIVEFHRSELEKIQGEQSAKISQILGRPGEEVIHRDNLVVFEDVE